MAPKVTRLNVFLEGELVGAFERNSFNVVSFRYDRDWLSDEKRAIPLSLSIPLSEVQYSGNETYEFLENLLPENYQVRLQLALNVGSRTTDSFSLLKKIGRDCVGAFQFVADEEFQSTKPVSESKTPVTVSEIAKIIRNLGRIPLGVVISEKEDFRILIAGFQNKTALHWDNGWFLPMGSTPTTHILKPAIGRLRNGLDFSLSVPNEHFCLTFCREIGLTVANSKIEDFGSESVLVVERFDRMKDKNGRLHRLPQEDMCQALAVSPHLKYEKNGGPSINNCLEVLKDGAIYPGDQISFLKAQIVYWMIGATDGHAKNFSIFHLPKNQYTLTPLYDVLSFLPNVALGNLERKNLKIAMSVGKDREFALDKITISHFLETAREGRVSIRRLTSVIEELDNNAESAFERTVKALPKDFPAEVFEPIGENIRNRAF